MIKKSDILSLRKGFYTAIRRRFKALDTLAGGDSECMYVGLGRAEGQRAVQERVRSHSEVVKRKGKDN